MAGKKNELVELSRSVSSSRSSRPPSRKRSTSASATQPVSSRTPPKSARFASRSPASTPSSAARKSMPPRQDSEPDERNNRRERTERVSAGLGQGRSVVGGRDRGGRRSDAVDTVVDTVKNAVTSDDAEAAERSSRKVREGTVVSNKMDKTAVVAVVSRVPSREVQQDDPPDHKLYAHDETNDVQHRRQGARSWRLVRSARRSAGASPMSSSVRSSPRSEST